MIPNSRIPVVGSPLKMNSVPDALYSHRTMTSSSRRPSSRLYSCRSGRSLLSNHPVGENHEYYGIEKTSRSMVYDNLPEPLLEEKEPWGVSSVRGTIYKDYQTQIIEEQKNEVKREHLWVSGLEIAFQEAKQDEELKHRRRQLTLYKFRQKRLENALKESSINYTYKRQPIIFTPNSNSFYNPNEIKLQQMMEATSLGLEKLATPEFRCCVQTPNGNITRAESIRKLQDIRNLKNMRSLYHWKRQVALARSRPQSSYSSRTYPARNYSLQEIDNSPPSVKSSPVGRQLLSSRSVKFYDDLEHPPPHHHQQPQQIPDDYTYFTNVEKMRNKKNEEENHKEEIREINLLNLKHHQNREKERIRHQNELEILEDDDDETASCATTITIDLPAKYVCQNECIVFSKKKTKLQIKNKKLDSMEEKKFLKQQLKREFKRSDCLKEMDEFERKLDQFGLASK